MLHQPSLHHAAKAAQGNVADFSVDEIAAREGGGTYGRFGKRALDLLLLACLAPMALPLVALFAVMASFDGASPFYGHLRVGRGGRLFTCWKIRTMVPDADARLEAHLAADPEARAEWDAAQKLRRDPRITRFGALLRSTSLDELPQLWNILLGEMTFVGPRPFTPDQTHLYRGRSYYSLRPGLTGMWQVGDRNDTTFAARAVDDARYARELCLPLDLRILVKTAFVVLRRTGR